MNNIPQRSCVICKSKKNKNELVRVVKNNKGIVSIDETGKEDGRGAYICSNMKCFELAIKSRKIEKKLEIEFQEEFYTKLKDIILKKQESKQVGGEIIG